MVADPSQEKTYSKKYRRRYWILMGLCYFLPMIGFLFAFYKFSLSLVMGALSFLAAGATYAAKVEKRLPYIHIVEPELEDVVTYYFEQEYEGDTKRSGTHPMLEHAYTAALCGGVKEAAYMAGNHLGEATGLDQKERDLLIAVLFLMKGKINRAFEVLEDDWLPVPQMRLKREHHHHAHHNLVLALALVFAGRADGEVFAVLREAVRREELLWRLLAAWGLVAADPGGAEREIAESKQLLATIGAPFRVLHQAPVVVG
ncbi:hypothetical protein [Acanthopleuribacter pedis]|uniref:Uncharacterized protein n=1 Tax=Acanthopleuribacter pedis TaxID=442870 RepID=A0A8J7QHT9_9BACT|nr:hypothetical protein [Acanthopleuribacter pedis]MBO1322710.1 hypothetical protein [Acanthopleuribacter pedis]